MRVVVDAHMVGSCETGNETYIVNLLHELARLPDLVCAAIVTPGAPLPDRLLKSGLELIPLKPANDWARLLYVLPRMSKRWRADVLHTTYVSPFLAPCKVVTTVHDVVFKRYPQFFSPRDRLVLAALLPLSLRRVDSVVTGTQHSQGEIVEFFSYLKDRVYVTPHAVSPNVFRPILDGGRFEAIRARYQFGPDFVLAVGNLQPRKNLERLIKAFSLVHQRHPRLQLVVVGKAQWKSSEIYTLVTQLGLAGEIVFTGYVPEEDLILLYNMAMVFVYPSLYEGFGLPVLEAMACGTPVITSNCSSLPEVAGDAAITVDPYSVDEIHTAIERVATSEELRHDLSLRGRSRAESFTWANTAAMTRDVYSQTIQRARG